MNTKSLITVLTALLVLVFVNQVTAQNPRPLWRGDAYVGGDFDVLGPNGATAKAYSATMTVKAATFIAGASEVEINIPLVGASLDNYALIYDNATGDIALRPVPSGAVAALNDITNVSAATKISDDLLQWNGTLWEATRLALILDLLDSINNVDTSGKSDGDVLYWNAGSSIWGATPQGSGSGGGASQLNDLSDVAIVSPASGEYFQYNGSNWFNNSFSQVLDDLNDVNASAPGDNNVLTYDLASGVWQPEAGGGGSGGPRGRTYVLGANDSRDTTGADAVADGVNDELDFITAFDVLSSAGGGTLLLLDGTFVAQNVISVTYDNIFMQGQGPKATTIQRNFNNAGSGNTGMLRITNSFGTNITHGGIFGIGFDGNNSTYSSADNDLIEVVGINDTLTIDTNYSIRNCSFINSSNHGLSHESGAYIRITNCVFFNNWDHGLIFVSSVNNVGVTANNIISVSNSVGVSINGVRARASNIYTAENITDGLTVGTQDSIIGNIITLNNGDEGLEGLFEDRNVFHNIIADNNTGNGFEIDGDNQSLLSCVAINNTGDGFFVNSGIENILDSCVANNNGGDGIQLTGSRDTQINNCDLHDNTGNGIFTRSAVDGMKITGNKIWENGEDGIFMDDAIGGWVHNNVIQNNTTRQIYLENGNDIYVFGNFLEGSNVSNPLIEVDEAFGTADFNLFSNNTFHGTYSKEIFRDTGSNEFDATEWLNISDNGGLSNSMILASSASAKIGIATTVHSNINNVIWVDQRATTNPIATSWDLHSDPSLKTNVSVMDDADVTEIDNTFSVMPFIKFDWRYPEASPTTIQYPTPEVYEKKLAEWEARKENYENRVGKKDQVSIDITSANLPPNLLSYDEQGKPVGVNTSQMLMRGMVLLKKARSVIIKLQNDVDNLKTQGVDLLRRVEALEAATP